MRTTFKKFFALLCSTLLIFGCSSTPSKNSGDGKEASDKILYVQTDTDLGTMDHHIATDGTSFIMQQATISGLTSLEANGTPIEELAYKWDISEDGTQYTFYLRDNANWSNGTPLTAADFVFAWQRLVDPNTASEYAFIAETAKIKNAAACASGEMSVDQLGIEAVDDKTLKVYLDAPVDFFLSLMAFPSFYPLNEAFFTGLGDQYALKPANLLACGPYILTKSVAGNSYTFTKNPTYWDAEKVALDGMVFKFIQDIQSAMLEFEAGNLDQVKLNGELVDIYIDRPEFTNRLQGYLWYMSVNHLKPNLQNADLRKAISYAIDRDKLAQYVLKDGSIAAQGIIPRLLATGPDGHDYRDSAKSLVKTDKELAKTYFKKAKQALGDKIVVELLYEDSEASKSVAEYMASEIETTLEGITISLKCQPKKARLDLMQNQNYEIGLTRWGPDYADPQTYLDLFTSTNMTNNNGRYANLKYDELVNRATKGDAASNSELRWELLKQAEEILILQDAGIIPVYQNGGAMMISTKVTGIEFHSVGVDSYKNVTKK